MSDPPPPRRMVRPPSGGPQVSEPGVQRLKSAKVRTASSRAWLERRLADPFSAEARARGFRSRSAFKLLELDRRFALISKGSRVVDLGCAPGGWLQVALKRGAGKLVGIDRTAVEPVGDALILQGDFIAEGAAEQVLAALDGGADLVLSDLAPNTTGHRATDHLRIMALAEAAVDFAELALVPGGAFVCKAFEGAGTSELVRRLQGRFSRVRRVKPKASLAESSEIFLVALGFRGD